jgi:hypothetical protein
LIGAIKKIENAVSNKLGDNEKRCWLNTYGRGVGVPLSTCDSHLEKSGLLCYYKCRSGYYSIGPVCYEYCPNGFRNDGLFCAKPAAYGRGGGYALFHWGRCLSQNRQGCEKSGWLVYPKCRKGFYPVGCCICSPGCQRGQRDMGVSCAKRTYGRGVGVPMKCRRNEEQNVGLCYPYCKSGYRGIGPVCWAQCPKGWKQCGALCQEKSSCTDYLKSWISPIGDFIKSAAKKDVIGAVGTLVEVAANLAFPICK